MELPLVDVHVEDRSSPVLWQHGGHQASRADTAHSSSHGGASEGGESASLGLLASGLGNLDASAGKLKSLSDLSNYRHVVQSDASENQSNVGKLDELGTVPRKM